MVTLLQDSLVEVGKKFYIKTRLILFCIWLLSLFFSYNHFQWKGLFFAWIIGSILGRFITEIEKQKNDI